jgi:hypothetical protein
MIPLDQFLTDADHEYILANGDHDRATEVSRKLLREWAGPKRRSSDIGRLVIAQVAPLCGSHGRCDRDYRPSLRVLE